MGATGPRQRQGSGAQLGDEQPVEVARAVAQTRCEPLHPLAVDDSVGDEAHGPAGAVGGDVPPGGVGGGVGEAASAGPEPCRLRRGGRRVERDVPLQRGPGRTGRAAVDPGGADRGVEDPVEAPVTARHGAVARVGVGERELGGRGHAPILRRARLHR